MFTFKLLDELTVQQLILQILHRIWCQNDVQAFPKYVIHYNSNSFLVFQWFSRTKWKKKFLILSNVINCMVPQMGNNNANQANHWPNDRKYSGILALTNAFKSDRWAIDSLLNFDLMKSKNCWSVSSSSILLLVSSSLTNRTFLDQVADEIGAKAFDFKMLRGLCAREWRFIGELITKLIWFNSIIGNEKIWIYSVNWIEHKIHF